MRRTVSWKAAAFASALLTFAWLVLPPAVRASERPASPEHLKLIRTIRQVNVTPSPGPVVTPLVPLDSHFERGGETGGDSADSPAQRVFRVLPEQDKSGLAQSLARRLMTTGVSGDSRDLALLRTLNELNGISGGLVPFSTSLAGAGEADPLKELEPNDDWLTAQSIGYGAVVAGEAVPDRDLDVFSFEASAGDFVRIEGRPTGGDGWITTLLFDPDSNLVSSGLYGFYPMDLTAEGERLIAPIWGGGNVIGATLEKTGTYRVMIVARSGYIIFYRADKENAASGAAGTAVTYNLSLDRLDVREVTGSVRDEQGRGVPGVELYYWSTDYYNNTRVVTDADGSFRTGLPEGEYSVSARSPEDSRFPQDQLYEYIRVDRDGAAFDYRLKSGVVFSGTAREDRGPSVPWLAFGMWDRSSGQYRWAGSDSSGRYSLAVFPGTFEVYLYPGWQYPVQPRIEGLRIDADMSYDLVVDTGNRLSGRILGPEGEALAQAQIVFQGRSDSRYAFSGEDGTYEAALSGGEYTVTITPRDGDLVPSQQLGPYRVDRDLTMDLKLSAGAVFYGSVADSRGNPVRGALVNLWRDSFSSSGELPPDIRLSSDTVRSADEPDGTLYKSAGDRLAVYTGEDGTWRAAVIAGTWNVEVIAPTPDYPWQQMKAGTYSPAVGERVEVPKAVIEHGTVFHGRVLLPDGSPLQWSGFYLHSGGDTGFIVPADGTEPALYRIEDGRSSFQPWSIWVSTDSDGRFRQRVLPDIYTLQFEGRTGANGYPNQKIGNVNLANDREMTLNLDGGFMVGGRVATADGKGVPDCGFYLYAEGEWFHAGWAYSDRNGEWAVRVTGGDYILQIQPAAGYFADSERQSLKVGSDTRLDIKLEPGITVGGVVTDRNGRAVPGVMIQLNGSGVPEDTLMRILPVPMPLLYVEFASDGVRNEIFAPGGNFSWTDENGFWSMQIKPGVYDLFAWPPAGYAALYRPSLDIGEDVKLELVLEQAGIRVSGRVEREDGTPADGALVSAWDRDSGEHTWIWTDAAGRFEIMLPVGKYEFIVDAGQENLRMEVLHDMELSADRNFNVRFGTGLMDDSGTPGSGLPRAFALSQNAPNPFNPSTTIQYSVSEAAHVKLAVFDIRGRMIAALVDREVQAGNYSVQWDGRDTAGRQVASGVYFYRMQAGSFSNIRKMVLLK